MILGQLFYINGQIVTDRIDKTDFLNFTLDQASLSSDHLKIALTKDERTFLQNLQIHNPNFVMKQEKLESLILKVNYLNLECVKLYKKYSEPYTMDYKSINQPCIDLKRTYQISPYRITLNSNFSENSPLVNSLLELRAGGFYDWSTLAFIIFMFRLHQGDSFQNVPLPHMDPFGWLSGKYDHPRLNGNQQSGDPSPSTSLNQERPSAVPNSEYLKMTKEQRRNLPDKRDGFISVKGYSLLIARYGQVELKTWK